jgi:DNA-binding NtrC family response regulator
MTVPWEILVVSSDFERRHDLATILNREDIDPICTSTISECREIVAKRNVGLVFCDGHLRDGNYRDLLSARRSMRSKMRVVVTSPDTDWDGYLDAMRLGAFDVIAVPCRPTDVERMLIQAWREERSRFGRTHRFHGAA